MRILCIHVDPLSLCLSLPLSLPLLLSSFSLFPATLASLPASPIHIRNEDERHLILPVCLPACLPVSLSVPVPPFLLLEAILRQIAGRFIMVSTEVFFFLFC